MQVKKNLSSLIEYLTKPQQSARVGGLSGSEKAYLVGQLYTGLKMPLVVVLSSPKDCIDFLDDMRFFKPEIDPALWYFPPYNILPFKHLSYHNETAAARIQTLYQLLEGNLLPIVVTTIDALMHRLIPKRVLAEYAELIMVDEEIERDQLVNKLLDGGYASTMVVEEPGDFSVRGGMLDVFPPGVKDPLRIEFFGDTVDSLRHFSAVTQRTIGKVEEVVILPAREIVVTQERLEKTVSRLRQRSSELDLPVTQIRELVERIKTERTFPGLDGMLPLAYTQPDLLFDYIAPGALFVFADSDGLSDAISQCWEKTNHNYNASVKEKRLCVPPEQMVLTRENVKQRFEAQKALHCRALPYESGDIREGGPEGVFSFQVSDNSGIAPDPSPTQDRSNLLTPLAKTLSLFVDQNFYTHIIVPSRARAERIQELLKPYGLQMHWVDGFTIAPDAAGRLNICIEQVSRGFVWAEAFLAVITDNEIFGHRRVRKRPLTPKTPSKLISFGDLKTGDLIVHQDHGIGRYQGLVKLRLDGAENDFLHIFYRDSDKLYLPVERMGLIQKYIGVDGYTPLLDKMGGTSWDRVKRKANKSAEKIAGELLKLYATRQVRKGFVYRIPHQEFEEFEAGFAFDETPDQSKAIENVINDLAASIPMDRLICGDVGYGKTEVALRASFIAVINGKQVALLVPTTVLAEQHYQTFLERYASYPVNIACLTRFRSSTEQRAIIAQLKAGKIDIVIGTHRLLSRDVGFKNLGLFVLDEEQRFGVKQKEKLKRFRKTVDVLAMTATPIPRTLHMSLMGIRDISVISTPPEQRQPIITYISELDDAVIADAVRKELARGGQLFFVHNHIKSIERMTRHIQKLVPEARLATAHGRMSEGELERVMFLFLNHEIDLLVCTAIIESGLDIPSANTILVNNADRFGLSQIYQLRGRVGRAGEQAYAYLFIPKESTLSKDAQKRLKVLMEHSDLGSGFQLAMSDLKIRGGDPF